MSNFGVKRISFNTHSTSDNGHREELVKEKLIQKTTSNPTILRLLEDIKRKKKAEVEQNIAQLIGIKVHQLEVENVSDQLTINITFYVLKHYKNPELKTIEQFQYIKETYIQGAADPILKLQIINIFNSLEPLIRQIINMRKSLQRIEKSHIRFNTHSMSDTGLKDLIKEAKPKSVAVLSKPDSKIKIKQRELLRDEYKREKQANNEQLISELIAKKFYEIPEDSDELTLDFTYDVLKAYKYSGSKNIIPFQVILMKYVKAANKNDDIEFKIYKLSLILEPFVKKIIKMRTDYNRAIKKSH